MDFVGFCFISVFGGYVAILALDVTSRWIKAPVALTAVAAIVLSLGIGGLAGTGLLWLATALATLLRQVG